MRLNPNKLILLLFITLSNCAKLVPKKYQSNKFTANINYWHFIFGQEVRCPNNGVIKNFVLRKSGKDYYFDLECYSSEKKEVDYGEPIVKDFSLEITTDLTIIGNQKNILALNKKVMDCTPENGLNGFKIFQEKDAITTKIKQTVYCNPTKSRYVSPKHIKTKSKFSPTMNLDGFVDILVGSTSTETEESIGYPLRSFQFLIEGTGTNRQYSYIYSYSILKNMGKLKDERLKQFEELRNKNPQVD